MKNARPFNLSFPLILLTTSLFFNLSISPTFAQTKQRLEKVYQATQQEKLAQISEIRGEAYMNAFIEALGAAKKYGYPIYTTTPDGRAISLQRLDANGKPVYYSTFNAQAAATTNTNTLYPEAESGFSLTGKGMLVGVWDGGGTRVSHDEFGGRVRQRDNAALNSGGIGSNHATHVAGTIGAAGVRGEAKGMAYEVNIDAYDSFNDLNEMRMAAAQGLLISNHSYGEWRGWNIRDVNNDNIPDWVWEGDTDISETEDYLFGFYTEQSREWDELAYNAPYYLLVVAAGNSRNLNGPGAGQQHYVWNKTTNRWVLSTTVRSGNGGIDGSDCLTNQANAKNTLTVGAVRSNRQMSDFSSWGPTDDGRIKPDLVGVGVDLLSPISSANDAYDFSSGTSMSSPNVVGSLILLQQYYEQQHGAGNFMQASTLKALALHTAEDLGRPGPDYEFGWGLLDSEAAAKVIAEQDSASAIQENILKDGEVKTISVRSNGEPLKATIAWTDPAGTPLEPSLNPFAFMLVHDLDLRISGANETYKPFALDIFNPHFDAKKDDNLVDNVEQVLIENPVAGEVYTITVSHKFTLQEGEQAFGMIVSGGEVMDAGEVFINDPICPAADVIGGIVPNENGLPNVYTSIQVEETVSKYILVAHANDQIIAVSDNLLYTKFENDLAPGEYSVYHYFADANHLPLPGPQVEATITDIAKDASGFYNLSTGVTFNVVLPYYAGVPNVVLPPTPDQPVEVNTNDENGLPTHIAEGPVTHSYFLVSSRLQRIVKFNTTGIFENLEAGEEYTVYSYVELDGASPIPAPATNVMANTIGQFDMGCFTLSQGITFKVGDITGFGEPIVPEGFSLQAAPNPFHTATQIQFTTGTTGLTTIGVYALNGRKVKDVFYQTTQANQPYQVSLSANDLAQGIYLVKLWSQDGTILHKKIMVVN